MTKVYFLTRHSTQSGPPGRRSDPIIKETCPDSRAKRPQDSETSRNCVSGGNSRHLLSCGDVGWTGRRELASLHSVIVHINGN